MKKLNRKGYLVVEIVVSASIAFVIAYFLLELTVQLSNKTDDSYKDVTMMTDKALITKNIKELIKQDSESKQRFKECYCYNTGEDKKCELNFYNKETKTLSISENTINYGDFTKKISSSLTENKLECSSPTNGYIRIKLTSKTIYSDYDYGFDLVIYTG